MTGWHLFISTWNFEPSVVVGCALLLAAYLWAVRFHIDAHAVLFLCGLLLMFLALVSPLDELGDDYLFSAHMTQHILLDMVAPLFFALGLPAALIKRILSWRPAAATERVLGVPLLAWALGVGTIWVWHLPALYNLTLENEAVHTFEHLTFLVTGTILFWPVFKPIPERRLSPFMAIGYLCLAAIANSLLGIIFTLASTPFYSGYSHPDDELGALSLIRNQWGLNQVADQQLGGVLMWTLGSVIFLGAIMVVFVRWYRQPDFEASAAVSASAGLSRGVGKEAASEGRK
jgi:putative membrane protein